MRPALPAAFFIISMETSRLYLKPIAPEDAGFLLRLMNTDKWHLNIGDRKVYTEKDALKYMQDRMDPDLSKKGFVNHVMIQKETGNAVGTCSLHDREGVEGMDIGYALLPSYEGYGYAQEGAKAMINLAFNSYNQSFINAITTDQNVGSCRILEKLGFTHQGYIRLPDNPENIKLYTLRKNQWKSD
ncbi:GNAT family N-acetyltransferase [Ekhidna sp.]|uniref:GNAT family N-acetyltransferase n=1 Tax=Ekhidna sp. TaxID=2608089 RepID=UPI003CCB946F